MKYHVLTPFSRFQNLKQMALMLSDRMERMSSDQSNRLEWILLLDSTLPFSISVPTVWTVCFYSEPAIPFWRAWSNHLNHFLKTTCLQPDDRYIILNDDDFVEPDFFKKLDQHSGELVICSMKRGHRVPAGGHNHPCDTLMAQPANITVGRVGCEQMIVSGRLLSTVTFADHICADGMAIVALASKHPVEFAPEAFVWFNYLEPGRWNV